MLSALTRLIGLTLAAVVAWLAIAGGLMFLPPACSMVVLFVGLILFMVGAELHWRWSAFAGGILMFAGVFSAALLGALG
jgi:hypothetical protein